MPRNLYSKKQGVVRHEFILGKSGTGKTELILSKLAQQTRRGGGWAYIDAKPEAKTEAILSTMASLYGRQFDLRIIDLRNPANSHSYNPILSGNTTQAVSTVGNLFGDSLDGRAKHFKTMMLAAMQPAIGCIKEMNRAFTRPKTELVISHCEGVCLTSFMDPVIFQHKAERDAPAAVAMTVNGCQEARFSGF